MIRTVLVGLVVLLFSQSSKAVQFPELEGWKLEQEKRVYNHTDLWQLINGAADVFLSYDFRELHIAEYKKDGQIIRAEVYIHSNPRNAFGIYAAERMPDYPVAEIGATGYTSEGIVSFLTGNCYVKVMTSGPESPPADVMLALARKVNSVLGQCSGLPPELELFPETNKVRWAEGYVAKNFLGYSFLHSAFTAQYTEGSTFQVFVIHEEPQVISDMLGQYFDAMKEDKVRNANGLIVVSDLFNGTLYLKQTEAYLIGVVYLENETTARKYIEMVVNNLNE